MLNGRMCEVVNSKYGQPTCPKHFADRKTLTGLIVTGPHPNTCDGECNYSFLVITEGGWLFETNEKNIRISDYSLPPF